MNSPEEALINAVIIFVVMLILWAMEKYTKKEMSDEPKTTTEGENKC